MKLDELKQNWQSETTPKNEQQLIQTIKKRSTSVFARVKLRAVLESVALLLVLIVFFTGLDAHLNAAWVNGLFALAIFVGVANNAVLYRRTVVNARGNNLVTSLRQTSNLLHWQTQLAIGYSILLFVGVFAFLLLRVPLTDEKLLIAFFALPALIGIRTWIEVRQWQRSMNSVQHSLAELNEGNL